MQTVKNGDVVRVHYHGTLNDGSTFDSSEGREPLEFTVGSGQVIRGFDDALLDMSIGQKKSVIIPVDNAYGHRTEEMIIEFPKDQFPDDMTPEAGQALHMSDPAGNIIPVVIAEVRDTTVLLDANHPLAGQDLNFEIELVSIA